MPFPATFPSGSFPAIGFNPAPGITSAVNDLVEDIRNSYTKIKSAHDILAGIVNGTGGWTGVAADAFSSKIKELPKILDSATDSFRKAKDGLDEWHEQLRAMQRQAQDYERQAEEARRRLADARSDPSLELINCTFPTQSEADRAQRRIDNATARIDAAQRDLNDVIENARKLFDHHESVAQSIARLIQNASDEAPDEPGMWDRLMDDLGTSVEILAAGANGAWDWAKDHANAIAAIGDVLSTMSLALGVVGIALDGTGIGALIGGPVGVASGALSAAALVVHGTARTAGADVTNRTLMEDSLGAVTLGIGSTAIKGAGVVRRVQVVAEKTGDATGAFGSIDSVAAIVSDRTALGYFLPKNERQAGEVSLAPATGGLSGLAVPFENAWKAGSAKDRAS